MKPRSLLLMVTALAGGCTQLPPLNFTPATLPTTHRRLNADLRAVSVTVAQPAEKRGALDFNMEYSKTIPDIWKTGVEDSLNRALLFSDGSPRKVNVRVKILEYDLPDFGAEMHTRTTALYEVQDRASGAILLHEEVTTTGVTPAGYAFVGVVRAMESANRAVQENIVEFIRRLDQTGLGASVRGAAAL